MKHLSLVLVLLLFCMNVVSQPAVSSDSDSVANAQQRELLDENATTAADGSASLSADEDEGGQNFYQVLKTKFIEGTPAFMSLVALTLIIGLSLCIERILRLTSLQSDASAFVSRLQKAMASGDVEEARALCREEPHPLSSVALTALDNIDKDAETRQQMMQAEGNRRTADLEKGCSWISLCIRLAPSLGFLGTVIGMVIAFDKIESAGDISPTLVAAGMKVALITTIFGIITALILQVFYNIILGKIRRLVNDMEQYAPQLLHE